MVLIIPLTIIRKIALLAIQKIIDYCLAPLFSEYVRKIDFFGSQKFQKNCFSVTKMSRFQSSIDKE